MAEEDRGGAGTASDEATGLEQHEIVWILPRQRTMAGYPEGFGLEIEDFLGPGDPDFRNQPTVWVRGPVVDNELCGMVRGLRKGELVTVAIPHDQPRARRTGGLVLRPAVPRAWETR